MIGGGVPQMAAYSQPPTQTPADLAALAQIAVGDTVWICTNAHYPLRPEYVGAACRATVIAATPSSFTTRDDLNYQDRWSRDFGNAIGRDYPGRVFVVLPKSFRVKRSADAIATLAVAAVERRAAA